ncbi:MAG: hypothetical protein AAGA48_07960 [Myxococcota bacterium]
MDAKRALRYLPDPDPRGNRRILRRLARSRAERRHRWTQRLTISALALAAVALTGLLLWPEPPRTLPVAAAASVPERVLWSDQVDLTVAGSGRVTGTDRNLVVDWQLGELTVRVAPESGVQLAVHADEGRIEVAGTHFTVVRDALGLTTQVAKGSVRVACTGEDEQILSGPSGALTCLPQSPARLLGRADALEEAKADPELVRDTLDRALASFTPDADNPVRGELLVRRMRLLSTLGAPGAALDDAEAYVAQFDARVDEVHRFAADLAILGARDCRRALPHLEALRADPDPAFRFMAARCRLRMEDPEAVFTAQFREPLSELGLRWLETLGEHR